ncbi:MAG: HAD-IA family hydrolase [Oscillospiraceae bacterium]|nr:HAD-IA family hydrolase [Oscillospiraceae bacterium]
MEYLDIYDERRVPTGRTAPRGTKLCEGEYYLVVHMFIFRKDGKFLIQRRVPEKHSWPDMWDISLGGMAQAGDSSASAAEREAFEELGLKIDLQNTSPVFSFRADNVFDDYWMVQLDTDDVQLTLQNEEVAETKWVDREEWEQLISERKVIPYTFMHQIFDLYHRNFPGTRLFPFGNPERIRGAVFDMDGLLLDTERVVNTAWDEAARITGFADVERAKIACLGCNEASTRAFFLRTYGENFDYQTFRDLTRKLAHEVLDVHVPVKDGAEMILRMLKERGIPLAVASSTRETTVRDQLDRAGLLRYFDAVITGDMVENGKPHPEIYSKACNAIGIAPEECLAFEDSKNGIRSAYRAGMYPVQIPDQVPAATETYALSWKVFPSLVEAAEFLEQTNLLSKCE